MVFMKKSASKKYLKGKGEKKNLKILKGNE